MSAFPPSHIIELSQREGNNLCADCNAEDPSWCSVNSGVFICTACSGVHRSLGVEYSFVQSIKLDSWTEEQFKTMLSCGGNTQKINIETLEYNVPPEYLKPTHTSSRNIRDAYIQAKYVNRLFMPRPSIEGPQAPVSDNVAAGSGDVAATSIGEIEFSGVLMIQLISAKNLIKADIIGSSDPYVVFALGHQVMKSKVISNNLNPVWNEAIMLSWDGRSQLRIEVMDKDWTNPDDPIGHIDVDLRALDLQGGKVVPLDLTLQGVDRGTIQFTVMLETFA